MWPLLAEIISISFAFPLFHILIALGGLCCVINLQIHLWETQYRWSISNWQVIKTTVRFRSRDYWLIFHVHFRHFASSYNRYRHDGGWCERQRVGHQIVQMITLFSLPLPKCIPDLLMTFDRNKWYRACFETCRWKCQRMMIGMSWFSNDFIVLDTSVVATIPWTSQMKIKKSWISPKYAQILSRFCYEAGQYKLKIKTEIVRGIEIKYFLNDFLTLQDCSNT